MPSEPRVMSSANSTRWRTMKVKAKVVMARYRPLRRSEGTPTTRLAMAATAPEAKMASQAGKW
ncbi:hypothetical protein FQZ97_1046080 [compost metagenome]